MSYTPPLCRTIFSKGAVTTLTGTAVRTSMFSFTLKAGTMGLNDTLRFWQIARWTNSANNKTFEILVGGATIMNRVTTTTLTSLHTRFMANRNSLSSQVTFSTGVDIGLGSSTSAIATLAVNTANDLTVEWFGTLATSTETMAIETAVVTLIKGQV